MRLKNRRARGRDAGGWLALGSVGSGLRGAESGAARAWLRETGSLTARLQRSGPTAVQLLYQGLRRPPRDEWRVLRLAAGRVAPVREVVLRVAGRIAVFAHTAANRAAWKLLRRAGRRPLATVLFTDPRVKHGPLRYRQLDLRHPLYRAATAWCEGAPPRRLAARRALFARGAARLLVTEIFLPWSPDSTWAVPPPFPAPKSERSQTQFAALTGGRRGGHLENWKPGLRPPGWR